MKILELRLKNFSPILSGMGKEEICLDLRNSSELINVFIGKIGSGKTYVLSHLQPFSTVGTLDVRNADDPIIPEKDGKKIIIYEHNNHEYVITHDYIWTGKSHTKKSYIEKDGVGLNENGNSSSFKDIILLEFGIDQSFLRLLRLGPNVVNFINMKATERKAYVASLLENTEVYLMLYKAWSAELRTLNTKVNILMNKLNSFGTDSMESLEKDLEELDDKILEVREVIESKSKKKYTLEAENKSVIGDMSYKEMREHQAKISNQIQEMKMRMSELTSKLDRFSSYPEITEVSKEIGRLDGKVSSIEEKLHLLDKTYNDNNLLLNSLKDKRAMSNHKEHLDMLKSTYNELLVLDEKYKTELNGFKCDYSSTFLTGFLEDLNGMNMLINEIIQYDSDTIRRLFNSDSSVIQYSKKQEEILGYRKMKVQKMINNLKFSETYEPSSKLYFPPFCPTHNCPYHTTHPVTIQNQFKGKDSVQEQITTYQNEIKDLDIELYKYSEYPLIYSKLSTLKSYWKRAEPVLKKIDALRTTSLLQLLTYTQYQVWYDYDKIINTIDLIEKRDQYYELTEKMKTIKNEINELSLVDNDTIDKEIVGCEDKKKSLELEIEENEKVHAETLTKLTSYNTMYVELSEKSMYEDRLKSSNNELVNLVNELKKIESNDELISSNISRIQQLNVDITQESSKLKKLSEERDRLKTKINDMRYADTELSQVLIEQKYMTYMVDSVSSKKGIPLAMIQIFLDACKDIVNKLIYDVCEDDLEIVNFQINESEFKIPYTVNGQIIDDISKASQGQTSIVSTAMSFALIRQTGSTEYNIPLLDEVDAPLHKSDKQKFISILLQHLKEIHSEQCFVITHDDNTFDGYPVQIIMTTEEKINKEKYKSVIQL